MDDYCEYGEYEDDLYEHESNEVFRDLQLEARDEFEDGECDDNCEGCDLCDPGEFDENFGHDN